MFNNTDLWPTPARVGYTMLKKISPEATSLLDPSAGKGDLADLVKRKGDRRDDRRTIDCIEINPELCATLRGKEHTVVGTDWLTYEGVCYYDAIIMNPPFSEGAKHLLKAWEFLWGGEIVCLLNAETVRNPYTAERKRLAELIASHGDVTDLGQCFTTAQRPTDVEVVMVYLRKQRPDDDLADLWSRDKDEKIVDESAGDDQLDRMLARPDMLGNLEHYYNEANEHVFKAFNHLRKASEYLRAGKFSEGYDRDGKDLKEILITSMASVGQARAEWSRLFRRQAWLSVFRRMEFHRWLDSKQAEGMLQELSREATIPFTAANIHGTLDNIVSQRQRLFEQSCCNVFDELTRHFKGNTASEGWKTNDNFKVNRKLISPYGVRFDYRFPTCSPWEVQYDSYYAVIYSDVDRLLCVLNGLPFDQCQTVGAALRRKLDLLNRSPSAFGPGDQRIESSHFDIRFFKKGTVHLTFLDEKLWQRFNAACAAGRLWLGMNTNGRDEFPGRPTQYGETTKPTPPPPNADALLVQLRKVYSNSPAIPDKPQIQPLMQEIMFL